MLLSDYVPAVFRWNHGGRNVYITGTFNNWDKQVWEADLINYYH